MEDRGPLMVTEEEAHALYTVMRRVLKMNGTGVTNSPDGITIDIQLPTPGDGGGGEDPDAQIGYVTNADGTLGTESTASDWVYDLFTLSGSPVGTALPLEYTRPNGPLLAAPNESWALYTVDSDGAHLIEVFKEIPDTAAEDCDP